MTTRDVGDRLNLQHLVYNSAGTLTNATVVLTVTDPAGSTTTPTVTNSATGTYTASFTLASAGAWSWVWTVSGTVVDVEYGSVLAQSPGPIAYASVPELKAYLGITDTTTDTQLAESLDTASRDIDGVCSRYFGITTTATARLIPNDNVTYHYNRTGSYCIATDDFWTTTSLAVAYDSAGDGTYSSSISSTDYVVAPFNGVVDGEQGWPYSRIEVLTTSLYPRTARPLVQVTAKWGWSAVPPAVKTACLLLASENFKLAREAPFGVAGYGAFGAVRVRDNPRVQSMIAKYRRYPVLVA